MTALRPDNLMTVSEDVLADARNYSNAMLNILADAEEDKSKLTDTQHAILNILDDAAVENVRFHTTQKAILNILEDAADETLRLTETQRAVFNILDDFEIEKRKVEQVNTELRTEVIERARAEDALRHATIATEEANRELEAFSYSVAHDLRAPLRSIDGFSQALLEDCAESLSGEGKTYLGYVRESAQHMARLIDDLLSFSRLSRAELRREPIDLAEAARTVFSHLQRDQPDRSVELLIPMQMPAVADARLIAIVLENLIGNAWKFTRKIPHACIEIGENLQAGHRVYHVRDNGAGFDMAYAEKLFAVFQRLHPVGEFEGTGIGLATVQRIIRRHGGRVWADGEVGRGATFYFTLEAGS